MQQFDPETGRLIRTYIRYKAAPPFILVLFLVGILGFSILFPLAVWILRHVGLQ